MRRLFPLIILFLFPLASALCAAQTDLASFESAIKGKPFALRSYSADAVTRYRWANSSLTLQPITVHALSAFTPNSVKLKKSSLIIRGTRGTLIDSGNAGSPWRQVGKSDTAIEIDLGGADPSIILPILQETLFFSGVEAAVANLPEGRSESLPWNLKSKAAELSATAAPLKLQKTQPPVLIYAHEAPFTEEARHLHVNGVVEVSFLVSETGHPSDLWLVKPLGYGLDESAAAAALTYRFKPAEVDDHPVATRVILEVGFSD